MAPENEKNATPPAKRRGHGNKRKVPKGNRYYGKTADNYQEIREKQPWWGVEQKEMKSLLESLPKGLKVLDVPFGTGRFVPYYIERGYEIYGLDASYAMIAQGAEILKEQFNECNIRTGYSTAIPYADNSFDLLVSTRFLRDIIVFKDAKKSLEEFSRVTTSYAIIQLGFAPAGGEQMPKEDERMGSIMSYDNTVKLLADYGFKVKDTRFVKGSRGNVSEIHHFLCEKM